jgi:hypothetical protein
MANWCYPDRLASTPQDRFIPTIREWAMMTVNIGSYFFGESMAQFQRHQWQG